MQTTVTRPEEDSAQNGIVHVAFELAEKRLRLACTTGLRQAPPQRLLAAGDLEALA